MYFSPRIVHTFATSQWITHSILTVAWLWAHQYYVWQEMFWNISTQFGFNFCWKTLRICQNINNEHILNKKSIIKNPKAKGLFLFEQENIWTFPHLGQMEKIYNLEANKMTRPPTDKNRFSQYFSIHPKSWLKVGIYVENKRQLT